MNFTLKYRKGQLLDTDEPKYNISVDGIYPKEWLMMSNNMSASCNEM